MAPGWRYAHRKLHASGRAGDAWLRCSRVEPRVEQVTTPDGRQLDVMIAGPEGGGVVLAHTGTPSSGRVFAPRLDATAERGLRHVSYARPGYADSSRNEGRSVADCAADVEAIADHLEVERFHTVGSSGGGPHALACAALLPGRVLSTATVGGCAPYDAEGLDWLAGMGAENIEETGLAAQGPDALRPWLEREAEEMLQSSPEELHEILGDLVSDVDRGALTGSFSQHLYSSMCDSFRRGVWGWLDDDLAFVGSWAFELDAIQVPVAVWHGAQDRFVPLAHGEWLAEHVPGARARLLAEHGHLSLAVAHYGDVLDDMLSAVG
jgi:pimeloyl-ACP methyl ester carboxylesterase